MQTLAASETPETAQGWKTVDDLRRPLADLDADESLTRRIVLRSDLGGRQYVSVPPLPEPLVAHLARLLPAR